MSENFVILTLRTGGIVTIPSRHFEDNVINMAEMTTAANWQTARENAREVGSEWTTLSYSEKGQDIRHEVFETPTEITAKIRQALAPSQLSFAQRATTARVNKPRPVNGYGTAHARKSTKSASFG